MADVNYFKADLRELEFALFEQFRLQGLFELPPYQHLSEEDARLVLKEAHTFASEVIGPTLQSSDREGCRHSAEGVRVPESFHALWQQYYENGWNALAVPTDDGGAGAPQLLEVAVTEMMSGANTAFQMYPALSMGAAAVIRAFGTPEQQERYAVPLEQGAWAGTMVLTEPHAGSDVGLSRTKAVPNGDGSYTITGSKIFISGGDQDLTENIVHLVLARIEGAPQGTRGLSLFIIPKYRVNDDGSLGEANDVACTSIEHKMGINASATAALSFGESGGCRGWLVGGDQQTAGPPGEGIRRMFLMMNGARIGVGVQSLAVASTAYLNALAYARERRQGAHITQGREGGDAVPIIAHADIRRMLLEMKSIVEGCRALIFHTVRLLDEERATASEEAVQNSYASLLVPLVKAHVSDMAVHVSSLAVQVYGGAGYLQDYPAEQYLRDARIFPIYEGTNGIQALDLVGRKLPQGGGRLVDRYLAELHTFADALGGRRGYARERTVFNRALERFEALLGKFTMLGMQGQLETVALYATPFLHAMAELTMARLLLEGAFTAEAALERVERTSSDGRFYEGKVASARFFTRNVLPQAIAQLETAAAEDLTAVELDERAFSLAF